MHDIKINLSENTDGLIIAKEQHIPDSFLQSLKEQRDASMDTRETEMMRVASIPTCLVEKWIKEGFDFWNEPAKRIVAKLKNENLEYFLTTAKSL